MTTNLQSKLLMSTHSIAIPATDANDFTGTYTAYIRKRYGFI
jgi:hypothetical protein